MQSDEVDILAADSSLLKAVKETDQLRSKYYVHTGVLARFWHGTARHGTLKLPCERVPCRAEPYRAGSEETAVPHGTARHRLIRNRSYERNRARARCPSGKRPTHNQLIPAFTRCERRKTLKPIVEVLFFAFCREI